MRYAAFVVAAALMLIQPAHAGPTPEVDPSASLGVVQRWIYNYRAKPDYAHVPAAVRVLFHSQTFKEPENAGIYLGFISGAIGSNPAKAEQLIASFFPIRPEDEWVIIRAIAYSGLPDWRNVLRRVAPRMPTGPSICRTKRSSRQVKPAPTWTSSWTTPVGWTSRTRTASRS